MKKLIAISLTVLYLSSFAGMVWASDCKAQQTYSHSSSNFLEPCNRNQGHSANPHSHPLLQFCKLIEVHKEVVVGGQQHSYLFFPATPVATNNQLYAVETPQTNPWFAERVVCQTRLFIYNRVLLL